MAEKKPRLFGTAGIRGLTNVEVTPGLALRMARAYGDWLGNGGLAAVGRDTRWGAPMLSLAASIWFWSSEVGVTDPEFHGEVFSGWLPRISAGNGWYATTVALLAGLLCLCAFASDAASHLNRLRVVHDDRNLGGGSLVPDRLRFRITSRAQTRR